MAVHNVALADVLGKQKPQPLSKRMFMVGTSTQNFFQTGSLTRGIALRVFASCDFELLHKRMYGWTLSSRLLRNRLITDGDD